MTTSLLISVFPPFDTVALSVPSDTLLSEIPGLVAARHPQLPVSSLRLSSPSIHVLSESATVSTLHLEDEFNPLVSLRLTPDIFGGKGGFGSQLRAAGGRMSSQKTSNNDSCRDLNGRRLSTIKEAKKVAQYLEEEPLRKKAAAEAQKAKLKKLERELGIGSSSEQGKGKEPEKLAGTKHRFDDTEYLEQSKDIVDGVKSAVAAGLLKKRKKAKLTTTSNPSSTSTKHKGGVTDQAEEVTATA